METIEFNTTIKDGVINIPPSFTQKLDGDAKVIVIKNKAEKKRVDRIEELLNNPLKIKDFKPMTRDEIYEGR